MKKAIMLIGFIIPFTTEAQVKNFESYPGYTGNDLGLMYAPQQSTFRIWAPTAKKAELILYKDGAGGNGNANDPYGKKQNGNMGRFIDRRAERKVLYIPRTGK
jgi:Carbohydrate-binding module 48 (Isoamylase N-terminal domain)